MWMMKLQHVTPAHGTLLELGVFERTVGLTMFQAPSCPSLFPLLNTALQVWILCSQRNGGPCD